MSDKINPISFRTLAQIRMIQSHRIQKDTELHVSRFIECARKGFLSIKAEPSKNAKVDLNTAVLFDKGTATEIWMINVLSFLAECGDIKLLWPKVINNKLKQKTILIKGKYFDATGSIDALIVPLNSRFGGSPNSKTKVPIEIKSKGGSAWRAIKKPERSHKLQLLSYMLWGNYPYGLLIYVDRDKYVEVAEGFEIVNWKIFIVERDSVIEKELIDRKERTELALKNNVLPDKEGKDADDPICVFCSFRALCWNRLPQSAIIRQRALNKRKK